MPYSCSVKGCYKYKKDLGISSEKSSKHYFPVKNKELMEKWLAKVDVKNITASSRICSSHFSVNSIYKKKEGNRERFHLLPGAIPLEFKANGQKLTQIGSETKCNIKEEDITEEADDKIKDFSDFIKELTDQNPLKSIETWKENWEFFEQSDGVCFYRLSRTALFEDVFISFKILVNKKMQVKLSNRYNEADTDELKWILEGSILKTWSQFYTILDYYQAEPEIRMTSSPLDLIRRALKSLDQIENSQEIYEVIMVIKQKLKSILDQRLPIKDEAVDINEMDETVDNIDCGFEVECNLEVPQMASDDKPCNKSLKRVEKAKVKQTYFKCHRCPEKFLSSQQLRDHLTDSHDGLFICDICGRKMALKHEIKNHMNIHIEGSAGRKDIVCHICGKAFTGTKNYNRHKIRHDESNRVSCPHCGDVMLSESMRRHIKVRHEGYKPHKCSICKKLFSTNFLLQVHKKIHARSEGMANKGILNKTGRLAGRCTYECPKCSKQYTTAGNYFGKHVLNCRGIDFESDRLTICYRYPCTICDKKFFTRIECAKHMASIHDIIINNVKNYCFVCKAEFENYYTHVRTHNCDYKCLQCNAPFLTQSKLDKHVKSKHEQNEQRPFSCDLCGAKFKIKNHLMSHTISLHTSEEDKKFVCKICNKRYGMRHLLRGHMHFSHSQLKKFACNYCDLKFRFLHLMKFHCKKHHGENLVYPCRSCTDKFSTLNELKHHLQDQHNRSMDVPNYHESFEHTI